MKIKQKVTEKSLKVLYKRCKPAMLKKWGKILTYEEFCQTLAYAHENGLDK